MIPTIKQAEEIRNGLLMLFSNRQHTKHCDCKECEVLSKGIDLVQLYISGELIKPKEIEWMVITKDLIDMVDVNIHGYINHPDPKKRKPVVSRVGKKCALKISQGIVAYLKVMLGKV